MHPPLSQTPESSAIPESSWVLPASSWGTAESESPEEPLLEASRDIEPPESWPPLAPSAPPSLDSMSFKASGDGAVHAGTRAALARAAPQRTTERAFMVRPQQSRCHTHASRKCLL